MCNSTMQRKPEMIQNGIFLTLSQEVTQPFCSCFLSSCKGSVWHPGRNRCRDCSICHQLLLEEDMQETKNVSAPGGETGLKSHLEFAEQFSELRGMALRGTLFPHVTTFDQETRAGGVKTNLLQKLHLGVFSSG